MAKKRSATSTRAKPGKARPPAKERARSAPQRRTRVAKVAGSGRPGRTRSPEPSAGATASGADPAAGRIIRRTTIHAGNKYQYHDVVIRGDDGRPLHRQMVKHPGAVTVLPLLDTPDGVRVVIIRNERFAVARTLIELPAGTLEPGEDPSVSGVRELEEEIGYTSSSLRPLGTFFTTPGLTDEIMYAYVATNLVFVGQRLEADEKIQVEMVTPDEALAMIDDGRMMDAKSMLALLLARRQGLL